MGLGSRPVVINYHADQRDYENNQRQYYWWPDSHGYPKPDAHEVISAANRLANVTTYLREYRRSQVRV